MYLHGSELRQHPNMTIAIEWDVKQTTLSNNLYRLH